MKHKQNLWLTVAIILAIGFVVTSCDNGNGNGACTHTGGAAATCTTAQTCTKCGDVMQGAQGHQGLTPAFAATCTAAGNSEASGTCTRAGCIVTGTVINALGHDWSEWTITTPPNFTAETDGEETRNCKRNCGVANDSRIYKFYALGDTGPAGGKIIYIAPAGFTMTDDDSTAYYLEAAPENMATTLRWSTLTWEEYEASGYDDSLWIDIPGTGTAIGTGRKNTALILALDPTAPAALACDNYSIAEFNDWFLPSRDELNQLHLNFGFSSDWFWSSSQDVSSDAWGQVFDDGLQFNGTKTYDGNVRAVRAF